MNPKTTCTPARSMSRAHWILASSSKRAFSSTMAVTDLPDSAAAISAATIGELRLGREGGCFVEDPGGTAGGRFQGLNTTTTGSKGGGGRNVFLCARPE